MISRNPLGARRIQCAGLCHLFLLPVWLSCSLAIADGTQPAPDQQAPAAAAVHTIRQDMDTINPLLFNHDKIAYAATFIPGGAYTTTTSSDPAIVRLIQLHAVEMRARMAQGNEIRPSDPVFHELFKHHAEIKIRLHNLSNGVEEWETSTNPQVTILIQAHTHSVAAFVREGMPAARRLSPLPPGYQSQP